MYPAKYTAYFHYQRIKSLTLWSKKPISLPAISTTFGFQQEKKRTEV